ncbi:phage tail tape measure protein [Streptomyces sp. ME03-5709C]|nr:phage tail tape measure protein [Streptomyces sp. ME03-5709C]
MGRPVAEDVEDYGSARITITLDTDRADADAREVGRRIERALERATRNIGRQIQRNIRRGMRSLAVSVRVEPDVRRFNASLSRALRGARGGISVPVTADPSGVTRSVDRALRRVRAEVQVRADARRLVSEVEAQLRRVRPPRISVDVTANVDRVRSQLRSLDAPRIEARVVLDVGRVEQQLRELAQRQITIPIAVGGPGAAASAGASAGASAMGGLSSALTAAGPWGAVAGAVAAYGALVGKALMVGIEGVIEHQRIAGQLQAALGVGAKTANQAGRVVGQLYAQGVVDTVEEGTAAVQAAIRSGLAAPDDLPGLESISTKISDVGRLMEEDIGKVARTVGTLVKTGLVDNASQGLDLLTRSVQKGGNVAEDLLDTFTEYPTQFRQLGLSAQEAFGLMQQGLRGGARDTDVIADTLKEFSIEAAQGGKRVVDAFKAMKLDADGLTDAFAKGGPSARKALDQVLDKLQAIKDPLQRNQAAVGLFGTKAEDMAGALAALDLDTAAKEMDNFGGSATRAGDALRDNLGTRLQTVVREAKQAFQGLFVGDFSQFADLGKAIEAALPDLKAVGQKLVTSIERGIKEYGPRIVQALFRLGEDIGQRVDLWGPLLLKFTAAIAAMPALMAGLLLTALAGVFTGLGKKLLPYLQLAWDAVVNFFTEKIPQWASSLGEQIAGAFRSAWQTATEAVSQGAQAVLDFFTGLPSRIGEGLSALPSLIGTAIGTGIGLIILAFMRLPGMILGALSSLGSTIWGALTGAFTTALSAVTGFTRSAVSFFRNLPGQIARGLSSLGSTLAGAFRSAGSAMLGAVRTLMSNAVSTLRGLPEQARRALSGAGTALVSVGRQLVQGMINGVRAAAGGLARAAKEVVGSAISAAKKTLGIASPSKVFAAIGKDTGKGFIVGLTGTADQIKQTTESLSKSITAAFKGKASKVDDRLVSMLTTGNKKLQGLAKERDALVAKIAEAQKFAADTTASVLSSFSLQNLTQGGGAITADSLVAGLDGALSKVRSFTSQINALARKGLRKDLLQQIIGLGPEQGAALARSLATADKATFQRINSLQTQLTDASNVLGKTSADVLFDAGKNAGAGFLAGLEGQRKAIEKLMVDIAKSMQKAIRTALRIKSPSRVFMAIGDMTGAGLHLGLVKSLAAVAKASRAAARSVVDAVSGQFDVLPGRVGSSLDGLGAGADVIPLTAVQRRRQAAAATTARGAASGAGAALAGAKITNNFTINEVGDGHATAHRVITRLTYAAGVS